jgi:CBS domain-containing protein
MPVAHILKNKPAGIVSAKSSDTVADVSKMLAEKRIGAVIVLGAGDHIEGIISERDIVRAVATHGSTALESQISNFMTRNVKTCSSADNEATLMNLMTTNRIRHLPVVDGGKLTGMISIGDVVKYRFEQFEHEQQELLHYIEHAG